MGNNDIFVSIPELWQTDSVGVRGEMKLSYFRDEFGDWSGATSGVGKMGAL